jgi:hypothetical protein
MRVRIAPGAVIAEIDHRQHAPRAPVQEPLQRDQQRRVGRSCSCSTAVRGGIRVVHADQSRSLHRARRHDIHSARSCGQSLATNLVARSDPDTSARPDWTRAAASSSSSLSGHCSSSFQQVSHCRLAAATDPNPRGRVVLRNHPAAWPWTVVRCESRQLGRATSARDRHLGRGFTGAPLLVAS